MPQPAWVLEDHHHATIAESVDVARERRSVFSDILSEPRYIDSGSSGHVTSSGTVTAWSYRDPPSSAV